MSSSRRCRSRCSNNASNVSDEVDKRNTSDGVSEKINFDDKIKKKIFPVGL